MPAFDISWHIFKFRHRTRCGRTSIDMNDAENKRARGLSLKESVMLGAGMICVSAAVVFYKQKRTREFKIAYALSWPVLGTAVLMATGAKREDVEKYTDKRGIEEQQQMAAKALASLKEVAESSKKDQ